MRTAVDLAPHDAEEARVRALAGLAQVEMLIGDMPAARAHATLAVDLARRSELRRLESHALCTLGVVLASLGDVRAGIDAGSQALLMALELGSVEDIGRAYVNLADVHWMAADAEAALHLAQEAISDIRLRGLDAGFISDIGYGAVLAAYDIGEWALARRLLDEADRHAAASPAVELYRAEYSLAFLVGSGAPRCGVDVAPWHGARRRPGQRRHADLDDQRWRRVADARWSVRRRGRGGHGSTARG